MRTEFELLDQSNQLGRAITALGNFLTYDNILSLLREDEVGGLLEYENQQMPQMPLPVLNEQVHDAPPNADLS